MGSSTRMALWRSKFVVVVMLLWGTLTCADELPTVYSPTSMCPTHSLTDFIGRFRDWRTCSPIDTPSSLHYIGVTEGDEVSLQKALNMFHKNNHEYVAILFYASWCPFSRIFRPSLSILSSLFPSLHRFVLRNQPSVKGFYSDVTGIRTVSLDQQSLDEIGRLSVHEKHDNTESGSCPFSWARSPENLLQQETYLALATTFVILRLLYFFFPTLLICIQYAWRRLVQNVRLGSLLERLIVYLKLIMQSFNCLVEPCKRSNLQEGAMKAKAWASKSLATVSIGKGSSSWGMH